MTDRPDLLRPREPAQSPAQADRETLDALLSAVDECKSLIAAQNEAAEQATGRQLKALQPSLDTLADLATRVEAAREAEEAREAELTAAMREMSKATQATTRHLEALRPSLDAVPALATRLEEEREAEAARHETLTTAMLALSKAVAGLAERLDAAESAHSAVMGAALDALRSSVEQNGHIFDAHARESRAVVAGMTRLAHALETLGGAALDTQAFQQTHTGQMTALDDLVKGTSSLGGRFRRVEQALTRHGKDVRRLAVAIPLVIAGVVVAFVMAGIMIGWFADPAGASLPWLEGVATPE